MSMRTNKYILIRFDNNLVGRGKIVVCSPITCAAGRRGLPIRCTAVMMMCIRVAGSPLQLIGTVQNETAYVQALVCCFFGLAVLAIRT